MLDKQGLTDNFNKYSKQLALHQFLTLFKDKGGQQ